MPQVQTDVIEDFAYNSENERYNKAYHDWRSRTKMPFIYRFRETANERTYTSGDAVEPPEAPLAERKALQRTAEITGMALMVCLFCEIVGRPLTVWLLGRLGFNIRLDFLTLSMQGSQWMTAAVRMLMDTAKYGIPSLILIRMLRLPRRVCMPAAPRGLPETTAGVGMAMMLAAVFTVTDSGNGVELAQRIFEYKDSAAIFTYALFDVLISSMLAELFLRGAVLQGLRQFGDPFAVGVTAFIGFLLPNTLPARISECLIGLCAGYLFLRSGSYFKCAQLRAIYVMLTYARLVLVYGSRALPRWSFVILLISIGALMASFYVIIRRDHLRLANIRTHLTARKKFSSFFETVSTFPWLALSALLAVVQLFY